VIGAAIKSEKKRNGITKHDNNPGRNNSLLRERINKMKKKGNNIQAGTRKKVLMLRFKLIILKVVSSLKFMVEINTF